MSQRLQRIRLFAITWIATTIFLSLHKETSMLEPYRNKVRGLELYKFESYTNVDITTNGCSVTVLVSDPRLALDDSKIWHSLESMAVNVVPIETTCVVLQTSFDCSGVKTKEEVYSTILSKSQPNFISLLHKGNVRISFINTNSYPGLVKETCKWNINRLWMHPQYWNVEFTTHDSDNILVLQSDSVFCHELDVRRWKDLAFVGSVWGRSCGLCNAIRGYWKSWNGMHEDIGDICGNGKAPSGNGGFSLRSRHWMQRVINTCPSSYVATPRPECHVTQDIAEDIYFATGLLGLHAPLPTSIESALFAAETKFLDGVLQEYHGNYNEMDVIATVQKRWSGNNVNKYYKMKQELGFVVPIGMHKPWKYHSFDVLMHERMGEYCPYFEKISHVDWLYQGKLYFNRVKNGQRSRLYE